MRVLYSLLTLNNQKKALQAKLEDLETDYYKSYDPDKVEMVKIRIRTDIEDIENSIKILEEIVDKHKK
jgi:hypothetical protein